MSEMREAFERWFLESRKSKGASRRPTFERMEDGTYADDHTQRHWWTWQNAQAARIAELEKEALAKPFAPDWAGYRQGLEDGKREGQAERDQLRAEVERLRADALRYHAFFASGLPVCFDGKDYYTKADCDAAIDATRTNKETE